MQETREVRLQYRLPKLVILSGDRILADALIAVLGSSRCAAVFATGVHEIVHRDAGQRDIVVLLDMERPPELRAPVALVRALARAKTPIVVAVPPKPAIRRQYADAGAAAFVSRADALDDVVLCLELVGRGDLPARHDSCDGGPDSVAASASPLESLTGQEARVLDALMRGLVAKQIARELVVSLATVRSHIRSVLVKLGARSQVRAVAIAHATGWRPDAPDQFSTTARH